MVTHSYTEALERALGVVIARANGELALIRERADALVAVALARVAEADANARLIEARVAERLASLRDGVPGRDGVDGKDGAPGQDGAAGIDGAAGRDGVDGAPGRDGVDGKDGAPGQDGAAGIDGAAGRDGVDGAPGRDGVDGKDGAPGQDGAAGIDGAAGRDGVDGAPGRDGVDGKDGAPGQDGANGSDGRDGVDGVAGKDGAPGREGPPGKLPLVKDWTEGVHYEGVAVSHNGSTFQALRDTGREPPHEDWICIAGAGRDGIDGRSFTIRGTWSDAESYKVLDVVALGGASFAARRDDPGPCPGKDWQLIAAQGKRGNAGERGVGSKGDRGPAGPAAVAIDVDDKGLLTLTNGDRSTVTSDLYPLLAKLNR